MTRLEQSGIDLANNAAAIRSAAAVGAVVTGAFAVAEHGQAVLEGRESESEAGKAVLGKAAEGAACGGC